MIIEKCKQREGKSKYCPDIYLDKLNETIKCLFKTVRNPPDSPTLCL
jgi:hypothetical protein